MIKLVFPPPQFRMKREGAKTFVFDALRRQWLVLTEEEWVRQNIVAYLVQVKSYPPALIALEKELVLYGRKKRFDVLVFDPQHRPWLLVECKAPSVPLSEEVLQQALRYNLSYPAPYIMLTNGNSTVAWKKDGDGLRLLNELPEWEGS